VKALYKCSPFTC